MIAVIIGAVIKIMLLGGVGFALNNENKKTIAITGKLKIDAVKANRNEL